MSSKREVWVDYVKVFACILVVLGHFFQSMVKANILPENHLYTWFNKTIYYFHVPLFFICSGYLYQKYSVVGNWKSWKDNVIKKAVVLGIPYFIFSFATWLLKTMFTGSVNNEIGGLADTLFLHPTSPYWYLYVLFFIFLVTPTACCARSERILLAISAILKLFSIIGGGTALLQIYAISRICQNEIWFVLGMMIAMHGVEKLRKPVIGFALGIIFIVLSILLCKSDNEYFAFGLGLMACAAVLTIAITSNELKQLNVLAKYTMPIFLMHTLFAAPTRTLLMKCGIQNTVVHVTVGIVISIIGPIMAMKVMELIKLDWLVYPRKRKRGFRNVEREDN